MRINRRAFVACRSLPSGGLGPKADDVLFDVNRHFALRQRGVWLRVYFNGEDVTNRCRWANDETGNVCLFKRNVEGNFYLDPENPAEVAREVLHGKVEFLQVEPW